MGMGRVGGASKMRSELGGMTSPAPAGPNTTHVSMLGHKRVSVALWHLVLRKRARSTRGESIPPPRSSLGWQGPKP